MHFGVCLGVPNSVSLSLLVPCQILLKRGHLSPLAFEALVPLLHRHLEVLEPQDLGRLSRFLVCPCCLSFVSFGVAALSVSFLW